MQIIIERRDPPVGPSRLRYRATVKDSKVGPVGYGMTAREAREDLEANIDDTWEGDA